MSNVAPIPASPRRRRRWPFVVGLVIVLPLAAIFAVPWLLNTWLGNRLVESRLGKAFAPGSLTFDKIHFSWFGPTRLTGIVLIDPSGKPVVTAPSATLSPTFWQLLRHPGRLGTLELVEAGFDVGRSTDDSIDLADALTGIFQTANPRRDLTIHAERAGLLVHLPGAADPTRVDRLDMLVHIRPMPEPITWAIDLRERADQSVRITGTFDRWRARPSSTERPDLALDLVAIHWPVDLNRVRVPLAGFFNGRMTLERIGGNWISTGSTRMKGQADDGNALSADWSVEDDGKVAIRADARSILGRQSARIEIGLDGDWDQSANRLDMSTLNVGIRPDRDDPACPPVGFKASGTLDLAAGTLALVPRDPIDPDAAIGLAPGGLKLAGIGRLGNDMEVEGGWAGSLGAIDRLVAGWSGRPPLDLAGSWTATAIAEPTGTGLDLSAKLVVADLSWPVKDGRTLAKGPVGLTARSRYVAPEHRLDVAELAFNTPFGLIRGSGRIVGLDGEAMLSLDGTIAPDWQALTTLIADRFEPGANVSGRDLPFHVEGPFRPANGTASLRGDFGIDLTRADLFGMSLGATPVVFHADGRSLTIDPIDTTLNGGRLRLTPRVDLNGADGPTLILEKGASLESAIVNDEVSRRVLSFVAPILDRATRASGRVSATIDRAEFPIASHAGRKANVIGSVVFHDVEFAPGPLARQLIGFVSTNEPGNLRLDEPVRLEIADGRVNQRGLAIPIGKLARVELDGWVDFDKNLGLVARFPLSRDVFPNRPMLGEIVAGTTIQVPIGGTLSAPKLDKDAFNASMKEMGKSLLTRSVGVGAFELLNQLAKPRVIDPAAPPPPPRPTPEEKRAVRSERRNERRMNRGLEPLPEKP